MGMKIGLDVRVFLRKETGIGIYFYNLVKALLRLNTSSEYWLFSASWKDRFRRELPPTGNYHIRDRKFPGSLLEFLWYRCSLLHFEKLNGARVDLVHSPVPSLVPGPHRNVITVHDLCLTEYPGLVEGHTHRHFCKRLHRNLRQADRIIAVSQFTRNRIGACFGSDLERKTRVIYHGTDFPSLTARKPPFALPDQYYLFVGTIEPRKNLSVLIKAMHILNRRKERLQLLVVGKKGWNHDAVDSLIHDLDLSGQVRLTEYLNRMELKYLFLNAQALILPSLYEGFGLPILEAVSVQLPVLCSDLPVFREIFQDYPVYFDPREPEDLAEKIRAFSGNIPRVSPDSAGVRQILSRCHWDLAARQTHELYQRVYT